jgi:hypothetical protein
MILFHKPFQILGAVAFKMDKWRWEIFFGILCKRSLLQACRNYRKQTWCMAYNERQGLPFKFCNFIA